MATVQELAGILEEFVHVMHQQTKALEKLIAHVEQATGKLDMAQQFSLIGSELAGLHQRVRRLGE